MKETCTDEILGYDLSYGQEKMLSKMLDEEERRLIVAAPTRYGKTQVTAIAVVLYILSNDNKTILLLAPTSKQTNILRNYISELIANTPQASQLIDTPQTASSSAQRLKKEASKQRVTFKNGCELRSLTAHGTGDGLMGFGADLIICDEAALIDDEVYYSRISRMLGDSPRSNLVLLVNPWERNFTYENAWENDDRFSKVHVDWRRAVEEGRLEQDFVEEQREMLPDYMFQVLYESVYPDKTERGLMKHSWIVSAKNRNIELENPETIYGLDVAGEGEDLNVLTKTLQEDKYVKVLWQRGWSEDDTMETARRVRKHINDCDLIKVDSIGIGKGVADRLSSDYNTQAVKVSRNPIDPAEGHEFRNLKAQSYWRLRTMFEEGRVDLTDEFDALKTDLLGLKTDRTAGGKLKIEDPNKSPDYADSLMLSITKYQEMGEGGVESVDFDLGPAREIVTR